MTDHPMPAVPGWYPDPRGHFPLRFWDGVRWTDTCQNGAGQIVTSALSPASKPAPWKILGLVAAVLIGIALIGSALAPPEDDAADPTRTSAADRPADGTTTTTEPDTAPSTTRPRPPSTTVPPPPSIQDQIGDWQAEHGYLLQAIGDDLDEIVAAATRRGGMNGDTEGTDR